VGHTEIIVRFFAGEKWLTYRTGGDDDVVGDRLEQK
jgi:hypothetical protein